MRASDFGSRLHALQGGSPYGVVDLLLDKIFRRRTLLWVCRHCGASNAVLLYVRSYGGQVKCQGCDRPGGAVEASVGRRVRPRLSQCACRGIGFGTYSNSVDLDPPAGLGLTRTPITIDACIAAEVQGLWVLGIKTVASCCGHNLERGVISVAPEHDEAMEALGYERTSGGWSPKYERSDRGPGWAHRNAEMRRQYSGAAA